MGGMSARSLRGGLSLGNQRTPEIALIAVLDQFATALGQGARAAS